MVFWIAAAVVVLISAVILLLPIRTKFADTKPSVDTEDSLETARVFYQQQLAELQTDLDAAKLGHEEFAAAKLELDREFLRQSKLAPVQAKANKRPTLLIACRFRSFWSLLVSHISVLAIQT